MKKRDIIGVVGLGLLGRGIAACFLSRGFKVIALDLDEDQHLDAKSSIRESMEELVQYSQFPSSLLETWNLNFFTTTNYSHLKECTFVIESITENLEQKKSALREIELAVSNPEVIIASNTSALPISELQSHLNHPKRIIGMHWAEPAHVTRFIELIGGNQTERNYLERARQLALELGKEPSLVIKDAPGFIVNRVAYAMYREVLAILEEGVADAETIDRSLRNTLGLWASLCGPLRWMDLTGGPELYAKAMGPVLPKLSKSEQLSPILDRLAALGARGITNGKGFFEYTPEEAKHWEELYREHALAISQDLNHQFPIPQPHDIS